MCVTRINTFVTKSVQVWLIIYTDINIFIPPLVVRLIVHISKLIYTNRWAETLTNIDIIFSPTLSCFRFHIQSPIIFWTNKQLRLSKMQLCTKFTLLLFSCIQLKGDKTHSFLDGEVRFSGKINETKTEVNLVWIHLYVLWCIFFLSPDNCFHSEKTDK